MQQQRTPPVVGLLCGREYSFPPAFVKRVDELGAAMAAAGAGLIRTTAGDYRLAFWIAGVLCVLAGTSFVLAGQRRFVRAASPAPQAA